jgi:hypothetical protein
VAIAILVILAVIGFRGCLDARQERSMKDYVANVTELAGESKVQGDQLFEILSGSGEGGDAVDQQNLVNGFRVQSADLVDRARELDVPDEMSGAQGYFLEALELRRDGLARVSQELPGALADDERRESTDNIAAVMQVFLTSDVLMTARFRPSLIEALQSEDLEDEVAVPRPNQLRFVPDIQWVDPAFVSDQIAGIRGEGGGGDGTATPGLHGNGLGTVTLGGVALVPGGSATVQVTDDLAFDVQVANQGENTETDVNVLVSVGTGDEAIELTETLDTIAAGETKNVTIPLGEQPPTGEALPVNVEIEPVDGEQKTDNNVAEYSVIFTR